MIRYILFVLSVCCATTLHAQTFTDVTATQAAGIPALQNSSIAWGDYDNDGDLDLLIAGSVNLSSHGCYIYQNNGNGTFLNSGISLPPLAFTSVAWGDYDNDGDLDIILTGGDPNGKTFIYRNNGSGTFADIGLTFPGGGVKNGSVTWGDYDNDGDLDILVTGRQGTTNIITKIYKNNGSSTFVDSGISLTGVENSSVAWGDYDNDGDLDILISGLIAGGTSRISKIYRNNGDGTFTDSGIPLEGVERSSVAWGDYDNDGYLDILLAGADNSFGHTIKIYHNNGNGTFTDIVNTTLPAAEYTSVAWGDYDNDGDLDILITGAPFAARFCQIYNNNGSGTFANSNIALTGMSNGAAAWADIDNDGDLDFYATGTDGVASISKLYKSDGGTPNTVPVIPVTLTPAPGVDGTSMTLSWQKATDTQTPQNGLSYNVYISDVAGQANMKTAMSNIPNGFRRIVRIGNNGALTSTTVKGLISNKTYYWSVQAIDGAYAGSPFAPEQSFSITVRIPQTITFADFNATYGDVDFTPTAAASSSLPLTFSSDNASVATIIGGKIHVVGPGTANITASQAGNPSYFPAPDVTVVLTVGKRTLTVTADPQFITYGDPIPTPAQLTYTITGFAPNEDETVITTPVAASTNATAGANAGDYDINLTGAAAANYVFSYVPAILTISPAISTITFNALPAKVYGNPDFSPGATVSNGLPLTYTSSDPLVATIENGLIHIAGAGTVTITASQAGNNNYDPATDVDQVLTIGKGSLTVTAHNQTINFGDPMPILTYTVTGFITGENENALLSPVSASTNANGDVGVYDINVSNATSDNYNITFIKGTLTIQRTTVNISFTPPPVKTYGDAAFNPGASISNGLPITYSSADPNVATIVGSNIQIIGAGTVTITAHQVGNGNYNPAPDVPVTLTVNKKELTVTAENKTIGLGDALPNLTSAITGFVNGESVAVLTTPVSHTTDAINTAAGIYTITSAGAAAANYTFTYVQGTLTVQKGTAQISFASLPVKTYGDVDFNPGATITSGLPITYTSTGVATIVGGNIHITGAGIATITAHQAGNANYNPATDVSVTLTVNKKQLTVTAENKTIGLGDAMPNLTSAITGFVNGETETVLTTPVSHTTDAINTTAGIYTITASGAAAANYTFTYGPGTLTVQKGTALISFTSLPVKTYGDADFNPGATIPNGLPITYTSTGVATIVGGNIHITGAGTATITAHQAGNANYNPATDVSVTLTVNKKQLTVTAENKTINLGDALPTLTSAITGFVNGESVAVLTTPVSHTTDAINTAAGIYTITPAGAAAANYDFTYVPGTLTVQKGTAQISFTSLPVKTYGDVDFNPGATITSGLPITYTSTGVATIVGGNIHITGAGTATITAHQAGNASYNPATDVSVTLTVNKKQLTVTPVSKTISLGDAWLPLAYNITGFVNGETESVFTTPVTITTDAIANTAGTFNITASGAAAANYVFSYMPGTLTVLKGTAQISFISLPVKTYGDADFNPGATIPNGLPITYTSANNSVATIVNGNIHITGAGTTTITAHQVGNSNYNPAADVSITLTVNKKQLTVTAVSKTINLGDAMPELTYNISGFVNGESATVLTTPVTITTDAVAAVGVYNITVSGAAAANYNFTYVPATLTIQKGTALIVFGNLPQKTYGDADFNPGATISSGLPITYTSTGVATIVGGNIHITGAGTATITAHQAGNGSYNPAPDVSQTLTVNKKQLTVTAENKTKVYGEPNPTFTYIITGFVFGETEAVFTTPISISASGITGGTHAITPSNAAAANYSFNYVAGTFTVQKGAQTITFGGLPAKTYGNADFNPGATASSGLAITYTSSDPNVATIVNGNIHITGGGTVTIMATQPGDNNYNAATAVAQQLIVSKATQTIQFAPLGKRQAGEPAFNPGATASSGLPITYQVENTAIATLSGNLLSPISAGFSKITATQPGNNNYEAAPSVTQELEVTGRIGYLKVNDAVTPNGDGINDFLIVEGIRQYPDNQLYISNASGKIIFEAKGYNNTGVVFRGLDNKGNKLSKGVYYYVLIYQGNKESGFFVLEY